MTPQENSMLQDLVRKVVETKLAEKDPEAEQLLRQGLGSDPDAIYKLAQTVLVQNFALNQARAQIRQMQQSEEAPPARATSFLGGLLGHRDPAPPVPQAQPQQTPAYQTPSQYATAAPYAVPASTPTGSFLRSAATTAAGVAAGALAFEGIESLIHGFGHGGEALGSGFGSGAPPVEETVINNYYDDRERAGGFDEHHEREASHDDRPESHAGVEDYQPDNDDDLQADDSDSDSDGGDGSNFS
jgi:uncharacterized protein